MTTTAIAIRDDQITFDDLQKRALVHIGVENATPADLAVFFHTCKRTGLDPFARQIYMIRRDGKQTMQTGIDGLRLVAQRTAERTGESFGYEDTQWCGEDGVWRDVWLAPGPPAAARVTVVRNGMRFPHVALFSEYVQTYRDKETREQRPTKTWTEKAALMLAKCAEAGALRKAFPQDLSGIYTPDERPAIVAQQAAPTVASIVGEPVEHIDGEVIEDPPAEPEQDWSRTLITAKQQSALHAALGELGITTRESIHAFCTEKVGHAVTSTTNLTRDEASAVIDAANAAVQRMPVEDPPEEP